MFDAISLVCSFSSKRIFLFQLLPSAMFPVIWITSPVIPAWGGRGGEEEGCFHFCSLLFASLLTWSWNRVRQWNTLWVRGLSTLENSILHLSSTRFLPLPLQFCTQVIMLRFNLINCYRVFGAPAGLKQKPFLFSKPGVCWCWRKRIDK